MKVRVFYIGIFFILISHLFVSCKKTDDLIDFTEADQIALGERLSQAIAEDSDYTIIPSAGNSTAYGYATSRLNEITQTSSISKGEDFTWTIYLLEDESRRAFAFPGGHIFISSGMIFFLDNEDQFSGLLAHIVAHVNESHITEALFFKYGVNGLKNIANSGSAEDLKNIINDLDLNGDFLTFTRANEIEADTLTISILSETDQSCESVGLFFTKTLNVQPDGQSQLIAAHLLDLTRIEDIIENTTSAGCDTSVDDESATRYQAFRNSLP